MIKDNKHIERLYKSLKKLNGMTDEQMSELVGVAIKKNSSAYHKRVASIIRIVHAQLEDAWAECEECGYLNPDLRSDVLHCENCGHQLYEE